MKWILGVLVIVGLFGCSKRDGPGVPECEDYVLSKFKALATYKRVSVTSVAMKDEAPPHQGVIIEYDASNSFGVPLRAMQLCQVSHQRRAGRHRGLY